MATGNKTLGKFQLVGIPPAPRGVPQIEVAFDIDANGIVHVTAKDLGTGKSQSIKIVASEKLTDAEIEKMRKEAEMFAEEDKKKKDEVDTVNSADSLAYSTEKVLEELKGKIPQQKIDELKTKTGELKVLIAADKKDVAKIKHAMEELNQKMQAASTELYKNASQKGGPQESGSEESAEQGGGDEKVVDADFDVKDDEK